MPFKKNGHLLALTFLSSGQENVNLAEALYEFDNGRLDTIISSGDKDLGTDLHSINAKACNVSRSDSKPLWFGFLYGSSSTLTGYTLLGKKPFTDYTQTEFKDADDKIKKRLVKMEEGWLYPVKSGQNSTYVPYTEQLVKQAVFGKQVQTKLISATDGLSDLITKLTAEANSTGGIKTLGGRFIPVNSDHKALNYFCQGLGADAMKNYLDIIHRKFEQAGMIHGLHFKQQATIYDEVDFIVKDEYVASLVDILRTSYAEVSARLHMKCVYTGEVLVGGANGHDNSWAGCH